MSVRLQSASCSLQFIAYNNQCLGGAVIQNKPFRRTNRGYDRPGSLCPGTGNLLFLIFHNRFPPVLLLAYQGADVRPFTSIFKSCSAGQLSV
ncbi:hypothetical protein [Bacillus sp. NRRL B-14911]|uniref:hypothetical protein n=1 Tax=Bacillus sp. NRRL B-14911 TaxID=313627 RepID=UPI00031C2538|nr:hypothetical protein [Bacillus sp. NRRL B-14911]